ncbi:spore germination protein GerPC [Paenibacillus oryzisoli]|uniref:spore germination protein GerPC n=1 Tax=Paenibacillus oryzisoli TaxID=1850517 RepID=UPI003D2D981D
MTTPISWQQWAQHLCAYVELQKQRIDQLEQTVSRLDQTVQTLTQTVSSLKQTVDKQQEDLKALKEEKRFHIDKIEYNFDQLKVEKLDGTLTIGISPGTLDQIDDFAVNGSNPMNAGMDQNPFYQAGQYQGNSETGNLGPTVIPGGMPDIRGESGAGGAAGTQAKAQAKAQAQGIRNDVAMGVDQYLKYGVQADMDNLEAKYQFPIDEDYRELIIGDIRKQLDMRIQHYINQYRGVGFNEPIEAVTSSIVEKTRQDIFTAIETYISSLPKKEG